MGGTDGDGGCQPRKWCFHWGGKTFSSSLLYSVTVTLWIKLTEEISRRKVTVFNINLHGSLQETRETQIRFGVTLATQICPFNQVQSLFKGPLIVGRWLGNIWGKLLKDKGNLWRSVYINSFWLTPHFQFYLGGRELFPHPFILNCLWVKINLLHILGWRIPYTGNLASPMAAKSHSAAKRNIHSDLAPRLVSDPKKPQHLACVPTYLFFQGTQEGSSEKALLNQEGSHKSRKARPQVILIHTGSLTSLWLRGSFWTTLPFLRTVVHS